MAEVQAMWDAPWQPGEFIEKQTEIIDMIDMLTPGMAKEKDKAAQDSYVRNWEAIKAKGMRRK